MKLLWARAWFAIAVCAVVPTVRGGVIGNADLDCGSVQVTGYSLTSSVSCQGQKTYGGQVIPVSARSLSE